MAEGVARKTGKKNRKFGRNKPKCAHYAATNRRAKNKATRGQGKGERGHGRTKSPKLPAIVTHAPPDHEGVHYTNVTAAELDTFHGLDGALMENCPLRHRRSSGEWCMGYSTWKQVAGVTQDGDLAVAS